MRIQTMFHFPIKVFYGILIKDIRTEAFSAGAIQCCCETKKERLS